MPRSPECEESLAGLRERIAYLEAARRDILESLDLAAKSGDFRLFSGAFDGPAAMLHEVAARVRRLLPVTSLAFWLVDEETANFDLALCDPDGEAGFMSGEFERLSDERIIALALNSERPVTAAGSGDCRHVVQALTTASRVRGLMIGRLADGTGGLPDASLALLTILLQGAASSLEGHELYKLLRTKNEAQREGLRRLAVQEEALRSEVAARKAAQGKFELLAQAFVGSLEGMIITNASGRILEINPAFTVMTGISAESILRRRMRSFLAAAEGRDQFRQMIAELSARGRFEGEVTGRRADGRLFPVWLSASAVRDEGGRIVNYVAVFHDITERKEKEEQIRHQAQHDALTGLPNRTLLLDRLGVAMIRALRRGGKVGVFFLDVDDFKRINDSMGHPVGDDLLRAVGQRLEQAMRGGDTVARLGGDEFVIMADDLRDQGDVSRLCDRISSLFVEPFMAGGIEHHLTISLGVTVYPDDGDDPNVLIRNADLAMYKAKEGGKGRCHVYTPQLTRRAKKRLKLERLLRRAIEKDEIKVHYQPQVDFATGDIVGLEALARWRRKDMLVLPSEFVPLAEECGLIGAVGAVVLKQACAQGALVNANGRCIRMAVNVSARQLEQSGLVEMVAESLDRSGFSPELLEIEITETALMRNEDRARVVLEELRSMGVQVSIDDFGTGYSSLSHLRRFPIKALKIDRGFIQGLPADQNSASIVEAILSMAKSLGLFVVAEGIETHAHLDFLRSRGCDSYQGFLFSRPLSGDELSDFLDSKSS